MSHTASAEEHVLADVIDRLKDDTSGEQVSIGDIITAFEDRSFGALCTVIGILAASPVIGPIPGMSIFTAMLVLLVAGQYLAGRNTPWIPSFLTKRSIAREKVTKAAETARPYAQWLDRFVKPRANWIIGGRPQRKVIAVAMCLLALTMIPLALVPWGVLPPALGIVLFGVALMGRDGAFAIAGYALSAVTLVVMYYVWGTIGSAISWLFGG
ncbi:MAG: exopolysaccharide biosynthesis protein [Alphaproteobacteria bacterium]|nr:exopolysaccharide biosynthesis protein [Alphaproteobacteria bacterium]